MLYTSSTRTLRHSYRTLPSHGQQTHQIKSIFIPLKQCQLILTINTRISTLSTITAQNRSKSYCPSSMEPSLGLGRPLISHRQTSIIPCPPTFLHRTSYRRRRITKSQIVIKTLINSITVKRRINIKIHRFNRLPPIIGFSNVRIT